MHRNLNPNNMNYKQGDKVRIKSDLKVGEKYGGIIFVHQMAKYLDKEITIEFVNEHENIYFIKNLDFIWTDEMIEGLAGVEEEPKEFIDNIPTYPPKTPKQLSESQYHEDLMRISAMAMQGLLANLAIQDKHLAQLQYEYYSKQYPNATSFECVAKESIAMAKALLTQLKLK